VDRRLDHNKLTIGVTEIQVANNWQKVEGRVLVKTSLYPTYYYGDELEISCGLKKSEKIEDFAYDRYLAKSGIYSICYQPWINVLSNDQANPFISKILAFKGRVQQIIGTGLAEPQSALINAIILGSRRGIPQDLTDKFSIVGISHIVAISGMHITIIAAILMSLAISVGFRRGQDFWLVVTSLAFYILLIGLPPSALRAGLMALMFLLGMKLGRLNKSINGLVFAATVMLLVNPKLLRDDIGFQLSFLAVLSLLYVLPFFEDKFERWSSFGKVKEMFLVTISAQAFTLPLIVYYFGRLSIVAPLANILVLPILPFVMILSFVGIAVGFLSTTLSQILFWPVWLLITYLIKVVEFLSGWPVAALNIESLAGWSVAIFYVVIFVLILKPWKIYIIRGRGEGLL